jgi:hypothetical protein
MRKIAFPIYILAVAIVLVIALGGYAFVSKRQHDKELAAAVVERNVCSETSTRPRSWNSTSWRCSWRKATV